MSTVNMVIEGRWGNALMKYLYARGYAARVGATLRTNDWLGRKIFQLDDPPIESQLPARYDMDRDRWDGETNIDLTGWGLHQKCILYTRTKAREWLRFRPDIEQLVACMPFHHLVAHMRHSDFVSEAKYVAISESSYVRAWQQYEPSYEDMEVVSESNPTIIAPLEEMGAGFLPDFVALMRATVLIRANSTFSYVAAILGDNTRVYAPNLSGIEPVAGLLQDVPFVLGNWPSISCVHPNCSDLHVEP